MTRIPDQIHRIFRLPYNLSLYEGGEARGRTVVFLHGIANDSSTWQGVLKQIPSGYRIITIDTLGFGASPKPSWPQYSLNDHVKSIVKTLKKKRIKSPVILVGHSLGALIAIELATRHPKLVSRLVLVGPPIYDPSSITEGMNALKNPGAFATNTLFQIYELVLRKKNLTLAAADKLIKLSPKDTGFALSEDTWTPFTKSLSKSIMQQDSLSKLAKIAVPTSIIYGTLDGLIIGKNYATAAQNNPYISVTRYQGGHFINKQATQKIIDSLAS